MRSLVSREPCIMKNCKYPITTFRCWNLKQFPVRYFCSLCVLKAQLATINSSHYLLFSDHYETQSLQVRRPTPSHNYSHASRQYSAPNLALEMNRLPYPAYRNTAPSPARNHACPLRISTSHESLIIRAIAMHIASLLGMPTRFYRMIFGL